MEQVVNSFWAKDVHH